jgi:hypothetical protein
MCGSEGDSEAWIERGLYAALLDMVGFTTCWRARSTSLRRVWTPTRTGWNSFLKLTAPPHFFSLRRRNDWELKDLALEMLWKEYI